MPLELTAAGSRGAMRRPRQQFQYHHAPVALVKVRGKDGEYLVKGKRVTGFTNEEEEAVSLTGVVPFLLEDRLKERGGIYSKAANWVPYVQVDGKLVTGQNPASSASGAEALPKLLRAI